MASVRLILCEDKFTSCPAQRPIVQRVSCKHTYRRVYLSYKISRRARAYIRQMLSFPGDRGGRNYANFRQVRPRRPPYIVATAAYFHDAHTGFGGRGRGRGERTRGGYPSRNYISPLRNCGLCTDAREATVFGFANVPVVQFRHSNAARSWSA